MSDELQPVAPVGQQPLQRRRAGPQRRRTEHERLLLGLLVLVEQHDHQARPAAEPAEQRALADACGGGDVVHRDRVGAALGDQPAGGIQQQRAVARGVAPFAVRRSVTGNAISRSEALTPAL